MKMDMKKQNLRLDKNGQHTKIKIILAVILIILAVGTGGIAMYLSDYSRAQEEALSVMANSSTPTTQYDGGVAFGDPNAVTGLIFYPGGKVEYTAYAPLIQKIAQGDVFCVIPEMPFNLAVFDSKAAEAVLKKFPKVKQWFISGHSLGGAMAADYAGKNPEKFKGLILMASYSASDISDSGLAVLSLYGSEDQVLNRDKYTESLSNLPTDYQEFRIEGGNHAGFGDYGPQNGDGTATIPADEQRRIATEKILEFIGSMSE